MACQQEAKQKLVVSRKSDGKWGVKRQGARCAIKTVKTQEEAEAIARALAAEDGVEVVVESR